MGIRLQPLRYDISGYLKGMDAIMRAGEARAAGLRDLGAGIANGLNQITAQMQRKEHREDTQAHQLQQQSASLGQRESEFGRSHALNQQQEKRMRGQGMIQSLLAEQKSLEPGIGRLESQLQQYASSGQPPPQKLQSLYQQAVGRRETLGGYIGAQRQALQQSAPPPVTSTGRPAKKAESG